MKSVSILLLFITVLTASKIDVNDFMKEPGVESTLLYNVPKTTSHHFNNYMAGFKYHIDTPGYPWWFGFSAETAYDMTLGYRALFFSMFKEGQNWIVINPQVWAQVSSENHIEFNIGIAQIRLIAELNVFKGNPLDY
jgi:hypothetical protein